MKRWEGTPVWAGVDTHKSVNVLAVLDSAGRLVRTTSYPATLEGDRALADDLGEPAGCAAVGVEGTMGYGKNLTAELQARGHKVVEVVRPKRAKRMAGRGKDDPQDAERAARDAMAGLGCEPKAQGGWTDELAPLLASYELAASQAAQLVAFLKSLVVTAPAPMRRRLAPMGDGELVGHLAARHLPSSRAERAVYEAARPMAKMLSGWRKEKAGLLGRMRALLLANAPALLALEGCGPACAARLAVAAGSNPRRFRSEAAFARFCGTAPVPCSSGNSQRLRLSRGGDRRANEAIYVIAMNRMGRDPRTRAYVAKKRAEGRSTKEALRCVKRYVTRQVYRALLAPAPKEGPRSGAELRARRQELGLTQAEVAEFFGVGPSRVSEVERDASNDARLVYDYGAFLFGGESYFQKLPQIGA